MKDTLTPHELSSMKRSLFQMIKDSGRIEDYETLTDKLNNLNFRQYTNHQYAVEVLDIINEMIELDDLAFELGQLMAFQKRLS